MGPRKIKNKLRTTKASIDRKITHDTGENHRRVSFITESFLEELFAALVKGRLVELRGFGLIELKKQGGAGQLKSPSAKNEDAPRFRVCFTKARRLRVEIHRKYKEKHRGEIWRR